MTKNFNGSLLALASLFLITASVICQAPAPSKSVFDRIRDSRLEDIQTLDWNIPFDAATNGSEAVCGNCTGTAPTSIVCLTEKQYVNCSDPDIPYTCLTGFCTADDPNGFPCSTTKESSNCTLCGKCNTVSSTTCLSMDTYKECNSAGVTGEVKTCPFGMVCDIISDQPLNPCVPFSGEQLFCGKPTVVDYCADLPKGSGLKADPKAEPGKCNTFIKCVDGVSTKQTCVAPKVFHPDYRACVNPAVYTCKT